MLPSAETLKVAWQRSCMFIRHRAPRHHFNGEIPYLALLHAKSRKQARTCVFFRNIVPVDEKRRNVRKIPRDFCAEACIRPEGQWGIFLSCETWSFASHIKIRDIQSCRVSDIYLCFQRVQERLAANLSKHVGQIWSVFPSECVKFDSLVRIAWNDSTSLIYWIAKLIYAIRMTAHLIA